MRSFGKLLGSVIVLWIGLISSVSGAEPAVNPAFGEETAAQSQSRLAWWRDAKFGLFIHWGPVSLTGKELSWSRKGPRPSDHKGVEEIPQEEYDALYKRFNPTEFDAREWVQIAKAAGMKYMVFTTKHHDGFSNFHTQYSGHSIANSPFKRDVVKELADACHLAGMRLGVYYSTRDWYHPDYLQGDNSKYNDFFHGQIRELLTNYGKVDILWFDHVGGNWKDWKFQELYGMIHRLQPEIVINNRGAAFVHRPADNPTPEIARLVRGDFDTPEQTLGRFNTQRSWESCITLVGGQWSYKPGGKMYTLSECIGILVQCVTGDGNLLLNVGPMPSGQIEPRQVERLREIGRWLGQYGESIYGTRGGPWPNGAWGGSTRKGNTVYLHVLRWDAAPVKLPPLKEKIVRHRLLTGGQAQVEQTEQGVTVSVPAADRHPIDTILALELEAPPALTVFSPRG
jgi:alpha-L-fucosidase